MSQVSVDPQILGVLSVYISEIEARTQQSVSETRVAGGRVCSAIADEVMQRRRRVEELRRQYEVCCKQEDADCSELWRQLRKAERRLEIGIRAQTKATEGLAKYSAQSNHLVQQMGLFAMAGKQTLTRLSKQLDDYSAFDNLIAASVLASFATGPSGGVSSDSNPGILQKTSQTFQSRVIGGRDVKIFDDPEETAKIAIFNQGSAFPGETEGTCGLCAVGTLVSMSGTSTDEKTIVSYAITNNLCTTGKSNAGYNGGTSGAQLVGILGGYGGINARSRVGRDLDTLASDVEKGKGVVIGVDPALMGGAIPYNPASGGHWVVLQSVCRDSKTNEVLGFFIFDSNGSSSKQTCQYLSRVQLEKAYSYDGFSSVVTNSIIW